VAHRKSLIVGTVALAGVMAAGTVPAQAVTEAGAAEPGVNRHLKDKRITESSGLARSTFDRPLLWTHNDSGDSARVFGVATDGDTRAVLRLDGADAVDWEDISTGPRHSIWAGDIGDNDAVRDHITVYRFKEPRKLKSGDVDWQSYDFKYADGPHNAEALMVRPTTGRLFVVTKDGDGGDIYKAPRKLSTSSVNKLKRVASAPPTVTAATFAPDGKSFVLVSYTRSYVFSRIGGEVKSEESKVNNSAQGESVEIGRGGKRMFLGQEGSNSPVYAVAYKAP
jgi:hypothetical protein